MLTVIGYMFYIRVIREIRVLQITNSHNLPAVAVVLITQFFRSLQLTIQVTD